VNAAIELHLDTAEEVAECFDGVARNLSAAVTMSVRTTILGTHVTLNVDGVAYRGKGRGLINALANALEEVGRAGEETR
jgi:uncharacterized protein YqfA (UPF0365 family)